MNFIVIASAFLITYRLLRISNFVDSLICWFIFYFFQIVFIELLSGVLRILTLSNVILIALLIFLAVWLFAGNKTSSFNPAGVKGTVLELLKNKIILLAVSLISGFALIKIFENLLFNPPLGWDSFTCHFAFPIEWLKHGNLDNPVYIANDLTVVYYPVNGSLYFLWLILPLRNVFAANSGQLPFYILAFLSVYNISRKIGLNKELSFYAAALFFITPNFFKEMNIGYVDVIMAALFLAGINFLLSLYKNFNLKNLILWSLSFGLFFGTKTLAIFYSAYPLLFFILILAKNLKKVRANKLIFYLAVFLSVVLITGGFTYIKNFVQTGNPFFPIEAKFLGRTIFKGVIALSSYRSGWLGPKEGLNLKKFLFSEGLGGQFIIFIISSLFLSIYLFLKKRGKNMDIPAIFVLTLPAVIFVSFYYFLPSLLVRYLYVFLGAGFAAAFFIIKAVDIPIKVIRRLTGLCLITSALELNKGNALFYSAGLSVVFFLFLPKVINLRFRKGFLFPVFLSAAVLVYLNNSYDNSEFSRYMVKSRFSEEETSAWLWLNNNTNSSNIAYVGRPDTLPLYGTNFKNNVLYVSVNKTHPAKLHYFPNANYLPNSDFLSLHKSLESPGNYRENPDYAVWFRNLRLEKIDFLLVYSLTEVKGTIFPIEDKWARNNPQDFSLVFSNDSVRIYEVKKGFILKTP